MNVTCSACQTLYKIDAGKVPPTGGFIKCRTCGGRIKIPAPAGAIPPAGSGVTSGSSKATPPSPLRGDQPRAAAGAIPSGGSVPPVDEDEAPTLIAPRPAAAAAIPLAGHAPEIDDDAPTVIAPPPSQPSPRMATDAHEQETVIAPTPSLPRRGGPIPLAGSAPTPRTGGAIPLGAGPAPASPTASIPLDEGTVPRLPPAVSLPYDGADSGLSPMSDAIPLAGSSVPVASAPVFSASDAPAALSDAVAALADDETQSLSTPARPPLPSDPTSYPVPTVESDGEPAGVAAGDLFADLPTVDESSAGNFATPETLDLPARLDAVPEPHTVVTAAGDKPTRDDLPIAHQGLSSRDDLPTPEGEAPSLMDDLSTSGMELMPLLDDLPAPGDEEHTLTEDLPTPHGSTRPDPEDLPIVARDRGRPTDVLELDAAAMSAIASHAVEPALHAVATPAPKVAPEAPAAAPAPNQAPSRPAPRALIFAGAAGVAALLVLVALATPYVGVQVIDPFGLADASPPPIPVPTPSPTKAAGTPPAEVVPADVAPVPAVEKPVLTKENVDRLDYPTLRQLSAESATTVAADDRAGQGLVAWARFRLAFRFGDAQVRDELLAKVPTPPEVLQLEGLGAAAAVGSMIMAGKQAAARKIAERLQRSGAVVVPQLNFVLALSYDKRPEQAKALKELDQAASLGAEGPDLDLARGRLLLLGREPAQGVKALLTLAGASQDAELRLTVADALLAARQTEELGQLLDGIGVESLAMLSAQRRPAASRLLRAVTLRSGNLAGAADQARARAAANPTDIVAVVEHVRLQAYLAVDFVQVAAAAKPKLPTDLERARLLAAEVRLHLTRGDLAAAQAALGTGSGLSAKVAGGWLKLAEGWVAKQENRLPAARAAFNVAGKGRPKFAEPRVELALLEEAKPGVKLKKLTDLEEKGESSWATYHLARLMRERGNAGGAVALFDRLLWTEPTVIDPIELLLEWSGACNAAGKAVQAEAAVRKVHEARPEDPRPLGQLMALAKRNKRFDAAVEWARVLANKKPDDPAVTVALAAALNDAGSFAEAQKLLDTMFKAKPESRTVEGLIELARSWVEREPFRAKDILRQANGLQERGSTYAFIGRLEAARENKDEAKKAFDKAVELEPALIEPRLYLARLALDAGATQEVIDGLERILVREPGHVEASTLLGDVFVEQGKPREALKRYEVALAVEPTNAALLMKVARLQLQRLNQLEAAVKTLRRVVAADATLAEPHFFLGLTHKDLGAADLARQELNTYLRLAPEGDFATDAKNTLRDLESE